MVENLGFNTP